MDGHRIDAAARALLFTSARTHRAWRDAPWDDGLLRELYGLVSLAPTAMNAQPARFVFVRSPEGKERLRPALAPGNVDKTMAAPATAIVAYDIAFHGRLAALSPGMAKAAAQMAAMSDGARERTAIQSATLSAGYLILAARGLGLDCGPMSGFDGARLDAAFFPDGGWRSILLVNLGSGDPSGLRPREPRLPFDAACRIA